MTDALSPSAIIIGALLAGFVLYLAKSNRLAVYYGLLFGGGTTSGSGDTFNPIASGQAAGTAFRNWLGGLFGGGSN